MSYSINLSNSDKVLFGENSRGPCDDYCPCISAIVCGLPEGGDIYQAAKKGLVWACHSNNTVPCVATNYNTFPKDAFIITEPEEFTRLTGYLC
jgi:hypothetical protein